MRWGKPPSSFILGTDSKKWSKWDYVTAEGYEIVQRERCPQCGLPRWVCGSDDERIQFRIKKDSCAAIEKKAAHEERHKKDKDEPGLTIRPEPYTTDDSDLIDFREPYYRALAVRKEADLVN